ncbi:MAG: phosphodiester glycosidase family protein [Clostridia bacterium]|nr:phosphodiester glycosidase family protein [Clostridia bacterium]
MKRITHILAFLCLGCLLCGGSLSAEEYRTLKQGDKGQAVTALKQRMYELEYFTSTKFSAEFNATTKERLVELQEKNGLTADGVATPEVQALIFSDDCLPRSATPRPQALSTPAPALPQAAVDTTAEASAPLSTAIPVQRTPLETPIGAPGLTAEGFLPEGQAPYSYADRKSGVWSYISAATHIEIRQHTAPGPLKWLEVSIQLQDPSHLRSMLSHGKKIGTSLVLPSKIMEDHGHPVLAFNDDFFGYRVRYGGKIGVIVRDGAILYDDPRKANSSVFPPLDVLAVFEDGSMKTFLSDAHSAQEYLDMGVRDTYAFGPILVQDGKINPNAKKYGTNRSPRLALGMTADGTIKVIDVLGRRKDAVGVTVEWMAEKMREVGCVEALNLDGGNTTCLIFMGDMINRPENTAKKDVRYISGLIGVEEDE